MPSAARLVNMSTSPKYTWPRAWSGTDDKALVNFASAAAKAAMGSATNRIAPSHHVRARRSNERVDIVGIGGERAIEKAARLRNIVRGQTLIEPSQALKIEVHRVGVRGLFRASRLGGDEFGVERARQARDDFVLHVEEIGERLVEPLGPEMIAGFGVDELHVDAHAVSAALNAALEDIADVQLAADLLQIDGFALVGEGGVAPDHDGAPYARKIGREALRDPVDEMLLLGSPPILANGRTTIERRGAADFSGAGADAGLASAGTPTCSE